MNDRFEHPNPWELWTPESPTYSFPCPMCGGAVVKVERDELAAEYGRFELRSVMANGHVCCSAITRLTAEGVKP